MTRAGFYLGDDPEFPCDRGGGKVRVMAQILPLPLDRIRRPVMHGAAPSAAPSASPSASIESDYATAVRALARLLNDTGDAAPVVDFPASRAGNGPRRDPSAA